MLPITPSLCIRCKGRLWCGLPKCPIIEKFESKQRTLVQIKDRQFDASSPPGTFVSWTNYPKVSIAPLANPGTQDNTELENPSAWFGKTSQEIIEMRLQLIQPKISMLVKSAADPNKQLNEIQQAALSVKPVESEFILKTKPSTSLSFNDTVAPIGASADLSLMRLIENPKIPKKVDSFIDDKNTKALPAMTELYQDGLPVHYLSRILSAGTLGVQKNRKLTPTRWSITAIDSNVSQYLINEEVKHNTQINEFELYKESYLGNHFFVLLCPNTWSFEMLECWLPGAGWAIEETKDPHIIVDFENYSGRTNYADNITGAYYAARLAVTEQLTKRKRQGTAIVFREITSDYSVPLGVWVIRETVRQALTKKPILFSDHKLALQYISTHLQVPIQKYLQVSTILSNFGKQKKISDFS